MLKNKKIAIGILIAALIISIFLIFFLKNNYKISEIGNTMSNKTIKEIEEYILGISSYEAKVSVTIESNKNKNEYVLLQKYVEPNISRQTVLEPSSLEGLETIYDGTNLTVKNTKLNLSKIYENYEYLANNFLCLETFISDYKENDGSQIYEQENQIILETNNEEDQYKQIKKLYLDKNTGKPTKLIIQDINEKTVVYILYNEVKINSLNKDEVLAFKEMETDATLCWAILNFELNLKYIKK